MAITEGLFHPKPPFLSFLTGWNSPITGLAFPGYCAPSTAVPATDGGLASGSGVQPFLGPKVPSLTIISHTKIMTHFILIGNCHGYNGKKTWYTEFSWSRAMISWKPWAAPVLLWRWWWWWWWWWLVGGAITILKSMSSSMGRILHSYYGK